MENKEIRQKKTGFMEEANYKNRVTLFHDRLKSHLSAEYMYVSERKDVLESEMVEIKFELEQKDKKLFKKSEQKDTRQYFSPLNLVDINDTHKDERMKQLSADVKRLENEIAKCDSILTEIKEMIQEIDEIDEMEEKAE
ncbi:MAG: hypothetical protein Q4E53_09050 [Eubacteriales bacterium]|nr:hypothetical protein [Eubacteriales bacterium]